MSPVANSTAVVTLWVRSGRAARRALYLVRGQTFRDFHRCGDVGPGGFHVPAKEGRHCQRTSLEKQRLEKNTIMNELGRQAINFDRAGVFRVRELKMDPKRELSRNGEGGS